MCKYSDEQKRAYEALGQYVREEFFEKSAIFRITVLIVSTILLLAGAASIGIWSHMIVITWGNPGGVIHSSPGIWGGFVALCPAIFGFLAVVYKSYSWISAQFYSLVCGWGCWANMIRLCWQTYSECSGDDPENLLHCAPSDQTAQLSLVCFALCIVIVSMQIPVMTYFICISVKARRNCNNFGDCNTSPGQTNKAMEA